MIPLNRSLNSRNGLVARAFVLAFSWSALVLAVAAFGEAGQDSAQTVAKPAGAPSAVQQAARSSAKPSEIFKDSLDGLQQTLGGLKLEKWKNGSIRAEAGSNIGKIQKDVEGTLPGLLADADAGGMGKLLSVSRNVDALYDVLLRVVDGGRVIAPGDQVAELQQAMTNLDQARRNFESLLEQTAAANEKQVVELQGSLKAQAVPACPAVPVAAVKSAPSAAKKPVKKKAKPAAPAADSTGAQPVGNTKPNQ